MHLKRFLSIILVLSMLVALVACSKPSDDGGKNTGTPSGTETGTGNSTEDNVPQMSLDGAEFSFLTFSEPHCDMNHVFDEPSDDPVSYGKYRTITALEERFECDIVEYVESEQYVNTTYRSMIQSGADDYDIVFAYDRFAHYFAEEGSLYSYDDLIYIDLEKDYWDQSLLDYTTVYDTVYYAYGTYDFTYYDLTHCLTFNKKLATELGLGNLYALVDSGEWTIDKMYEMCEEASFDNNSDDKFTRGDVFGLVSSGKQILPNFWIAAGTTTIKLDKDRLPYASILSNERLLDVIDTCFRYFRDTNVWYVSTGMGNQSDYHNEIFKEDGTLFADYTFYYLNQLRDSYSDFGIIPYPKFDADQDSYYSRVEAGTCLATVPITNPDPDFASAIIEAMASTGYKEILPEYYTKVLQGKVTRDEESQAMLDLIFKTRVYDLGDTWYCDQIRDGLMAVMWNQNKPNIASMYTSFEKSINKTLYETIQKYIE